MIIKDLINADKEYWKLLDQNIYQNESSWKSSHIDLYIKTYIDRNIKALQEITPNKKVPLYYYLVFEVDPNEILQMKINKKLGYDLGYVQALFIQEVIPEGYEIKKAPPNTFGESASEGVTIAIVFNKTHSLSEIKKELTTVLVHELNHHYDRTEFNSQSDKYGFNDAGTWAKYNVMQNADQAQQLGYIYNILNTRYYKNILPNNMREGIFWVTRIEELKSIAKEFLKYCDYNSIDFRNVYSKQLNNIFTEWLTRFFFERLGVDFSPFNHQDKKAILELYRRVFNYVKHNIQGIISKLNKGKDVKFREEPEFIPR